MSSDQFVRIGAASAPAFSRDGKTLFHLRGSSLPQVWALDLAGGGARALTTHDEKVALIRRAPKDDRLLYGTDRGGDERQALWLLEDGVSRPLTAAPDAIHDFGAWSPDGTQIAYATNARDPQHLDVVVQDVSTDASTDMSTGASRLVWHGTHETRVLAWQADGTHLLVSAEYASCDARLHLVPLDGGPARPIPRTSPVRISAARWTPDGTLMAITDAYGGDMAALCRIDPETGAATPVYAPEGREVEAWSLSPDGTTLATIENDRGYAVLRVGPSGADRPAVEGLPHGVVSDLAWSPDGTTLAFAASDPVTPSGLWAWQDGAVRSLYQPEGAGVARFELVSWDTSDGWRIPGWLALPPGPVPEGGWPAVVWVHGGPAGQARANFRADMQALLAQNQAVLMPNVRGSSGYGRAWLDSDDKERRLDSVHDLAAGARWLAARPDIDANQITVMGQSYGGYMVLAALTEYPDLWSAGIDFYGIGDFTTLLANTGPWRRAHRSEEYGDPVRHRALFDRISPLRHVDRIRVPLLVLHGQRDPRVHITESEQLVDALRQRNKPVRYETFDYAGHGFIREPDRLRAYAAVAEFLKEPAPVA